MTTNPIGVDKVTLVLASASPARRAVLTAAGLDPVVCVSGVDEDEMVDRLQLTDPARMAMTLARAKAEDVSSRADVPDGLVLGCDSVLEYDGAARGKPRDEDEARRWAWSMSGRSAILHTGHWLIDRRGAAAGASVGEVAATVVRFTELTGEEIDAYVVTGEPLGVAGGFTIDGLGGAFVAGLEGDHSNVIGVSLPLLRDLARRLGVSWPRLWAPRVFG